jgi:hypothetical protein
LIQVRKKCTAEEREFSSLMIFFRSDKSIPGILVVLNIRVHKYYLLRRRNYFSIRLALTSKGIKTREECYCQKKEAPVMHKTQPPSADHALMPFVSKNKYIYTGLNALTTEMSYLTILYIPMEPKLINHNAKIGANMNPKERYNGN